MAKALRKACLEGPVPFGSLPTSVPGMRWSSRPMEMHRPGVQGTPGRAGDLWGLGLCGGGEGCRGELDLHLDLDAEG